MNKVFLKIGGISTFMLFTVIKKVDSQKKPVNWYNNIEQIGTLTYKLDIIATVDKGWHIYAQQQPKEAISVPTKITFNKNPLVIVKGSPKEVGKKEIQDLKEVGIRQYYYADKVDFVQTVQLKVNVKTNLSGTITYQACTDEMCLPAKTIPFSIAIP